MLAMLSGGRPRQPPSTSHVRLARQNTGCHTHKKRKKNNNIVLVNWILLLNTSCPSLCRSRKKGREYKDWLVRTNNRKDADSPPLWKGLHFEVNEITATLRIKCFSNIRQEFSMEDARRILLWASMQEPWGRWLRNFDPWLCPWF